MDERRLTFLPFPHVYGDERRDGLAHTWPKTCVDCRKRECEVSTSRDLEMCWQGLNFLRVDESLLIAGVVARDYPATSPKRSKMLASVKLDAVPSQRLREVAVRARRLEQEASADLDEGKQEILAAYRESEGYKEDIVELLRPSLEQTFAQVHDYRQLISQIVQHVNVILNQMTPNASLDEQLGRATPPVRSIYWAARLMEFKLESALFLAHPERIHDNAKRRSFRFHGAVTKYLSIYDPQMRARRIAYRTQGLSHGHLVGNPDAIGVIPHAFLDNAVKYAPDNSEIVVTFSESADEILFSIGSLGPRIAPDEAGHVFDLFFRGAAARGTGEDGTGFGLGLAHHIASEIGCSLSVEQERKPSRGDLHWTTFRASFQKDTKRDDDIDRVLHRARGRTRGGSSTVS